MDAGASLCWRTLHEKSRSSDRLFSWRLYACMARPARAQAMKALGDAMEKEASVAFCTMVSKPIRLEIQ